MRLTTHKKRNSGLHLALVLLLAFAGQASAVVDGVTDPGNTFNLTARAGIINTPDGDSFLVWGYAINNNPMQYPGPTLIVNQGATVTVTLTSALTAGTAPVPVSIVFPGQQGVSATGGSAGLLTQESTGVTDTVTYTFTANNPGTYLYQSGTQQQLQTEMGLVGTIIVRPAVANQAYNHPDTAFDHEYLFLLTEMDPMIHYKVGAARSLAALAAIDNTKYHPVLWFINGRNAPDTMAPAYAGWLPHQPYNSLPRVHPGDTALLRFVNAGRDLHPFHTHGNHFRLIARDGRMLSSAPGAGVDLSIEDFTLKAVPGASFDALWHWTGEKLGWDIFGANDDLSPEDPFYNHTCVDGSGDGYDDTTREYCADHGKPFPVVLPSLTDLTFGGFYSGSPFLGAFASLPPGEGGLNLNGGLFFMWHSHTEKEIINNDIFPGGMMTMMIVEPPGVPIP
ncbi:MAG TPA: multicopper oxidase domain-containing protein [Gammaproteobacteria bacterium]